MAALIIDISIGIAGVILLILIAWIVTSWIVSKLDVD